MIEIASYSLSYTDIFLLVVVALLVGMAKAGAYGLGMVAVPLLAIVFGGKASTGVLLPILILADIFAVYYYHRHANWQHLRRLMPTALIGVVIGTFVGDAIGDRLFNHVMVLIIMASLGIMIWRERNTNPTIPTSIWFVAGMGILGGFTTMVGNLAGPVMALYLLSMQLPKKQFIGTAAWFFLLVNVIKVPLHVWAWQTINLNTFILGTALLPIIALGALLGVMVVKNVPEKAFRWFVIAMVAVAAITMML